MKRVFWLFVFFFPFQYRLYKFLKPLSLSWLSSQSQRPSYFEPYADLFISDFFLLSLLGWCLYQGRAKLELLWAREQKLLTAFLASALLSVCVSDYASYTISYWRWGHLALAALGVYCLRVWLVDHYSKVFKTLATVVVFSGALECAVALPQYLFQHQLGLKFMGEPTLVSRHQQFAHFNMPKKAMTSLDYYWGSSQEGSPVLRASGTLPHPNILGGFLVFSILMTAFLYEGSQKRRWIGVMLVLQVVALFTSYSRSGLFACLGGLLLWCIGHLLQERKMPNACKPLVTGFALSIALFFPQIFYRGGVVSYNQVTQQSDQMRIAMQSVASLVIRDHPWLGVGFNNYLLAFANYAQSSEVMPIAVHNIYFLIAVETGLVGLGLFIVFCGLIIHRGWQMRHTLEGRTLLAIFLALLAIGAADYYPVTVQQIRLIFFLVAGLLSWMVSEKVQKSSVVVTLVRG